MRLLRLNKGQKAWKMGKLRQDQLMGTETLGQWGGAGSSGSVNGGSHKGMFTNCGTGPHPRPADLDSPRAGGGNLSFEQRHPCFSMDV